MKHVVEYKLHAGQIPYFIEDGGYFFNNWKLIGVTRDDVACYVPPSSELVTFDTKADFIAHIITLTMYNFQNEALTDEEKTQIASDWWDARIQ